MSKSDKYVSYAQEPLAVVAMQTTHPYILFMLI